MNIAELRTAYLNKIHAKRSRDQARSEALNGRTDHLWHTYASYQTDYKKAKKEFKRLSLKFAEQIAGDVELSKIIAKFNDERDATNKALLDAVRTKANVIIPGDKQ